MSFTTPLGQHGSYSAITNNPETKISISLNEVLTNWNDRDEIKYREPNSPGTTIGHYYSDSQQPEGFLEKGGRFFAHLADPTAQAIHRKGIEAVVKDLKAESVFSANTVTVETSPIKSIMVEKDFRFRKMLGQPLSVGDLKKSLAQTKQKATTVPSIPLIKGFSFFGEKKSAKRESVFGTLRRASSFL